MTVAVAATGTGSRPRHRRQPVARQAAAGSGAVLCARGGPIQVRDERPHLAGGALEPDRTAAEQRPKGHQPVICRDKASRFREVDREHSPFGEIWRTCVFTCHPGRRISATTAS